MANYVIGGDYDLVKEKQEIIDTLNNTENIEDLPSGFVDKCQKLFNFIVFSMLLPSSDSYVNKNYSQDDKFLSYMMIKIKREVDFKISTIRIGFFNNEYVFKYNPYFLFNFDLFVMVQMIKHELYHMIFLHCTGRLDKYEKVFSYFEMNDAVDACVNGFIPESAVKAGGGVDREYMIETYSACADGKDDERSGRKYFSLGKSVEENLEYIKASRTHKNIQQLNQMMQKQIKQLTEFIKENFQSTISDEELENSIKKALETGKIIQNKNKITKLPIHNIHQASEISNTDEASEKIAKEQLKIMLNDAKEKTRGEVSSKILRIIEEINKKPELKWQDYLRRYVGSVPVPYKKSILRNDRRQPNRLELKGRLSAHEVNIAIAVDVSGSISDEEFKKFITEIFAITKVIKKKRVFLIQCDSEIVSAEIIKSPNEAKKYLAMVMAELLFLLYLNILRKII